MPAQTVTNWLTFTPATPCGKKRAYIDLPAFSVTGLSWKGASEIVLQYNFSASTSFILLNKPTKPSGVNYGLCIRYRVGSLVYRYKLWDDAGFLLNASVYNGEIIKKNFVLEVWSYENEVTAVNAAAVRMITGVRSVPTDWRTDSADYALAVGAAFSNLNNITTLAPAPGCQYRFAADAGLSLSGNDIVSISDADGKSIVMASFGSQYATKSAADPDIAGKTAMVFAGGFVSQYRNAQASEVAPKTGFFVLKLPTPSGGVIISANGTYELGDNFPVSGKVRWGANNAGTTFDTPVANTWYIYKVSVNFNGIVARQYQGQLYDLEGTLLETTLAVGSGAAPAASSLITLGYHQMSLAEMIMYQENLTTDQVNQTIAYLSNKYGGTMPLPLTFDSGGAWLDNP